MFQKLPGIGMSNIDFFIANVMQLLSNAKIIFSQRDATDLLKKVFGSWTIMMKTAWKRQNSIGNFPAKNSDISELSQWP